MAHFFFIDESGVDKKDSPYEVLCAISIEDRDLWNFVSAIKDLEQDMFGVKYNGIERELKGRTLLKKKVFKHAGLQPVIPLAERTPIAKFCIEDGQHSHMKEWAALAQAKLDYVHKLLEVCSKFRVKVFASITSEPIRDTDDEDESLLRRDYIYLFERMYYFLEDRKQDSQGIVVFDELEKSKSHTLVAQIDKYFKNSVKGRQRASLIVPEPFFVHSDLTTGIQIADIIAYIISWGYRLKYMDKPARFELATFVQQMKSLKYHTKRDFDGNPNWDVWSINFVQ